MDGYTFMLERNRRLIRHEEDLRRKRHHEDEAKSLASLKQVLDKDLQALYAGLEGCGRQGSQSASPFPPTAKNG